MTQKTIRIAEIALGVVLVLFIVILFVFVKPQAKKSPAPSAMGDLVTSVESSVSGLESSSAASSQTTSSKSVGSKVSSASPVSSKPEEEIISVTIPEGYSLMQICKKLANSGVGDYNTLYKTATTADFSSYSCIANSSKTNRCYRLEGYLFPATYEFIKGEAPAKVFGKMLDNFESRTASYKNQAVASCGSLDKAIILASIIEKEAGNENYVASVSSVLHNRLKANWQLNCDATISYLNNQMTQPECDKYKYYYNTNRFKGLPAGPICNPGTRALNAAVNPANTNYMYFCNDDSVPPKYYFAATEEEQKANQKKCGY